MSFQKNAEPFIQLGIPVFPLTPKTKIPPKDFPFLTKATTDRHTVAEWDSENPDYNVALLANGDFCFLEFDQLGIRSAAEEMDEPVPQTRMQKSGSGGGHLIFRHTERSRDLGNRQAAKGGHEWFSFRAHNRYLVAGGSLHPNGKYYKTVKDVEPIPVPDWICDFVEKHTAAAKPKPKGTLSISEDFDFEEFCEHYGITIAGEKDDVWQIVEECPGVGYRHENSYLTGFYYDGDTLGWSCFAGGCPTHGMSIGELISYLNQTHEPYRGVIWDKDDDDLDGVEMLEDIIPDDILDDSPQAEPLPAPVVAVEARDEPEPEPEDLLDIDSDPEPEVDSEYAGVELAGFHETDSTTAGLMVKTASKFEMEELTWLWPQKIPKGKMSFFTGKPDCGKSLTLIDLIARVTTGADWPDGSKNENPPGKVILAASEDDPKDTLIPRLAAAGANLDNVLLVVGTMVGIKKKNAPTKKQRKNFDLKRDARILLQTLKVNPDITLLALDPITSFFGDVDTNKDKEVRPVMEAITRVCIKSGITVVGLIHSNKRSDVDAVHKVSGAGALAAVVRAVWGFSRDSEDKSKYHMAFVKGNLGRDKSGLHYSIEEAKVDIKGKAMGVPRIVWGETAEEDADDILRQERTNKDTKDFKLEAAKVLLKAQKFPVKAKQLYELGEQQGIMSTTIKNAKTKLCQEGFSITPKKLEGVWWWYLTADLERWREADAVNPERFNPEDLI